jgi:DNA-binding response OmpR family regulator
VPLVLVGLDDPAAGQAIVQALEKAGHRVRWVGAMDVGASGADVPDAVFVDGEVPGMDLGVLSAGWRQRRPGPLLYVFGGPGVRAAAARIQAAVLPKPVNPAAVVQEVAKLERAARAARAGNAAGALRLLGLASRGNPEEDAAWILAGAKELDPHTVLEALRPHVLHYLTPTSLLERLYQRRAFLDDEAAFVGSFDGSRTVKRLVDAGGLEAIRGARLVWALISSGAAALSREPPSDPEWPLARRTLQMRAHLRARTQRLRRGNAYEIVEVPPQSGTVEIDRACHWLALWYAPEKLHGLDLGDCAQLADPLWKQIVDARGILLDASARQRYDAQLRAMGPEVEAERQRQRLDAQTAEASFMRGQKALHAGDAFTAVSELAQAARRQPEEPDYEAFAAWARYLAETARGNASVEGAQRERQLAEGAMLGRRPRPRALFAIGLLCEAAGDLEAAREAMREALACDPRLAPAQKALARLG